MYTQQPFPLKMLLPVHQVLHCQSSQNSGLLHRFISFLQEEILLSLGTDIFSTFS